MGSGDGSPVGTLDIKLYVGSGERAVQYNGGNGALFNDITDLVVGLYDYGSISSTLATLGYLYKGAVAPAVPVVSSLVTSAPTWFNTGTTPITSLIHTVVTSIDISDVSNARRYLIRDFNPATGFQGNATVINFSNVPISDGTVHKYAVFAAAFDAATPPNRLGYTEALVKNAMLSGTSPTTGPVLSLSLNYNVFTNTMGVTPTLVPFVPTANLRDGRAFLR